MRLTIILLTAAVLQVAAKGYTQTVTLSLEHAPLQKVFTEIEKQTGYVFLYTDQMLQNKQPVDIKLKNGSLQMALDICFKNQSLDYTIVNKTIVLKPKVQAPALFIYEGDVPPIDIRGKITNEKGEPVVASIVVKGTNKGTSANDNGEFELKGVDENAVLVISGVGIESFEVKVNGRNELALNAKTKIVSGQEVVVEVNTGYQKIPKERTTGSFEFISKEQLNRKPGTDLLSRLEGVTTSLFFNRTRTTGSESTFSLQDLSIRGVSTLSSGDMGAPLIIVNNFPFTGNINTINPDDVENISILKDASAASIYGARATNGVIVITTRQGRFNQPLRIGVNSGFVHTQKPDLFHFPSMSSSEFIDLEKFLFAKGFYDADLSNPEFISVSPVVEILNKQRSGLITAQQADASIDALRGLDVRRDFEKYVYRSAVMHQHSLNLTGGTDRLKYTFSSGIDRLPGVLKGVELTRITLNLDNAYQLTKGVQFQTGARYSLIDQDRNSLGDYRSNTYNYQKGSATLYPYAQLADEEGNPLPIAKDFRTPYTDTAGGGQLLDWTYRPLDEMKYVTSRQKSNDITLFTGLTIALPAGLGLNLNYQFQNANQENSIRYDQLSYFSRNLINLFTNPASSNPAIRNPVPIGDIFDVSYYRLVSHNGRAQLNYSQRWNKEHDVNALAGAEVREVVNNSTTARYYGYQEYNLSFSNVDNINPYPQYGGQGSATVPSGPTGFLKTIDHFVSFFGNIGYTFRDRYLLTASMRKDAANLFGVNINNKWKPFWSVGAGWIVSNETFLKLPAINYLKLRGSFGFTGNVNNRLTPYTILSANPASGSQFNLPFYWIETPANPSLSWETTKQLNIAMDFRLFQNRLSGTIEWYRKRSDNLIYSAIMDPTTGIGGIERNSASMQGSGMEASLNYQVLRSPFSWNVEFSIASVKNTVMDYLLGETKMSLGVVVSASGLSITPRKGYTPYAIFSFPFAGLDPVTGDPLGYLGKNVSKNYTSIKQQLFDTSQVVFHGSGIPTVFGNFNHIFSYKKLSLLVSAEYRLGYYFRKNPIRYNSLVSRGGTHRDYSRRWLQPGDEAKTDIPSLVYPLDNGDRDYFYEFSSVNVLRGDNVRLRSVRISYTIDRLKIYGWKLNKVQVYGNVDNLGIIWRANDEGLDPDVNTGNALYPLPKRISAGVKIEL